MDDETHSDWSGKLQTLAERAQVSPDAWGRVEARLARARPPRRRSAVVAVAVAAAVIVSLGTAVAVRVVRDDKNEVVRSAAAPRSALPGDGRVALARDGQVTLIDAATGTQHDVDGPADPGAFDWSADGRWVAVSAGNGLWIAPASGAPARQLTQTPPTDFRWAPKDDTLAYADGGLRTYDAATGARRTLLDQGSRVSSLAWAPDAGRLAAVRTPGDPQTTSDEVVLVPSNGGQASHVVAPTGGEPTSLRLATFWPDGKGLLYWQEEGRSASLQNDGLPLVSRALGGGAEHVLATTLVDRSWVVFAPRGDRVVLVAGSSRYLYEDKHLESCEPATGRCQTVVRTPGQVQLDPAWSTDGTAIAFVAAPEGQPDDLTAAVATRRLWATDADGGHLRQVDDVVGARRPVWSNDSRQLAVLSARPQGGALTVSLSIVPVSGDEPARPLVSGVTSPDATAEQWTGDGAAVPAWSPVSGS